MFRKSFFALVILTAALFSPLGWAHSALEIFARGSISEKKLSLSLAFPLELARLLAEEEKAHDRGTTAELQRIFEKTEKILKNDVRVEADKTPLPFRLELEKPPTVQEWKKQGPHSMGVFRLELDLPQTCRTLVFSHDLLEGVEEDGAPRVVWMIFSIQKEDSEEKWEGFAVPGTPFRLSFKEEER